MSDELQQIKVWLYRHAKAESTEQSLIIEDKMINFVDAILTHAETAECELAKLKERTLWHLDPADLPEKERVVIVLLDDGQIDDDLICFNGTWLSNDNVIGWREADYPTPPEKA